MAAFPYSGLWVEHRQLFQIGFQDKNPQKGMNLSRGNYFFKQALNRFRCNCKFFFWIKIIDSECDFDFCKKINVINLELKQWAADLDVIFQDDSFSVDWTKSVKTFL